MLDNIKMLLSIASTDTSKDKIINYWIDYYTKMVLKYCHLDSLNSDLESIIEQMVLSRVGGLANQGATGSILEEHKGDIKSITRGDYQIVYKDSIADKQTSTQLDKIAISYQGQLNLWRRLDY